MKAKHFKYRSLAMKRMQLVNTQGKITGPTCHMTQISELEERRCHSSIKLLGGEIYKDLSDSEARAKVQSKFNDLLEKTNRDKVNSIGKLCIYKTSL